MDEKSRKVLTSHWGQLRGVNWTHTESTDPLKINLRIKLVTLKLAYKQLSIHQVLVLDSLFDLWLDYSLLQSGTKYMLKQQG